MTDITNVYKDIQQKIKECISLSEIINNPVLTEYLSTVLNKMIRLEKALDVLPKSINGENS